MKTYKLLFSPIKVGKLQLKNRIVMAPMGTRYPTYGGEVTERLIDYYKERALGGVGLVIVQFSPVTSDGRSSLYPLGIWDDRFIPGLRALAEAIKRTGAKVAIQIAHAGAKTRSGFTGVQPVSPSKVPSPGGEVPRELSLEEIEGLSEAFLRAALRAKEAGFDAVELHLAHGYLLNEFLSPFYNRRRDEYGGDVRGRARFALKILKSIKEKAGEDYPVLCRLCVDEGIEGGLTLDEGKVIAKLLDDGGADLIDVTAGVGGTEYVSAPPMSFPDGYLVPLAEAIKGVVSVPVITVGKIHHPDLAEEILLEEKADLIAIGRGLIADPDFANKAHGDRVSEIRPCIACNNPQCHGRIFKQLNMGCVVNPVVGREADFRPKKAPRLLNVLVAGGGPAGMECARVASLRGHRVTLFEKSDELGGQLLLASIPPHKEKLKDLIEYFLGELERLGVEVHTGETLNAEKALRLKADRVVVATGSIPLIPDIPGSNGRLLSSWDVLSGRVEVGERVALVGGGDVGCETAEYLGSQGKRVTIIEMTDTIAPEMISWNRKLLLGRLLDLHVELRLQSKVVALEGNRVIYEQGGIRYLLSPVDSVVVAVGSRPEDNLAKELQGKGIEVFLVGDCLSPRNIEAAIREGFEQAWNLS